MKKASDYFNHTNIIVHYDQVTIDRNLLLDIIKEIQIDTIKETVKTCADSAILKGKQKSQHGKYRKWQNIKEEEVDLFSYEVQYFVYTDSILEVADKLIKDL